MDSSNSDILVAASEIQKNRLYFVTLKDDKKPRNTINTYYFTIDDKLKYENFFNDNGPLNLCMLYHYCGMLNRLLSTEAHAAKKIIHYTTSSDSNKRVNAALLIASYSVIYFNYTPNDAIKPLFGNNIPPYTKFSDASYGQSNNKITLENCVQGLHKAFQVGFVHFDDFDSVQYEHFERVENGDFNWIVPNKFLAFCGPHTKSRIENGYPLHSPETYFNYFKLNHVTTVIRLNVKVYDAQRFLKAGFQHNDLFFADGSTPNDTILKKFLHICETSDGAIAVHCKAGLGRTGSLIGAYIIKHYNFTALEAIAWLRFCRPGSVIGCQQQWLEDKQLWLWAEGDQYRQKHNIIGQKKHKFGIYSMHKDRLDNCLITVPLHTLNNTVESTVSTSACSKQKVQNIINNNNMKERLKGISDKVDTMKLSDESEIIPNITRMQLNNIDTNTNNDGLKAVADSTNNSTKSKLIQPIATRTSNLRTSRIIEQSQQTQGDKLNQIKALRRRHSRSVQQQVTASLVSTESAEVIISKQTGEQQTQSHFHHTRSKSQPYRTSTVTSNAINVSSTTPVSSELHDSNGNNNSNDDVYTDDDDNNNNTLENESDTDNTSYCDDDDSKRHSEKNEDDENDNNGNNRNSVPISTDNSNKKVITTYNRQLNRIQMLNKRIEQIRNCEKNNLRNNQQLSSSSSTPTGLRTTSSSTASAVAPPASISTGPIKNTNSTQDTTNSLLNNNYNYCIHDRHNNLQRGRILNLGIPSTTHSTNTTRTTSAVSSPISSTTSLMKKSIMSCIDNNSNNSGIKYRRSLRRSTGNTNNSKPLKHNGCISRTGDINLDLNTMIVMTKSRGKRSLSSTRMEKEKTDEKSNKLFRKNLFNLNHGPSIAITTSTVATTTTSVTASATSNPTTTSSVVVTKNLGKNLQKSFNHTHNNINNLKKSSQTIHPPQPPNNNNNNSSPTCEINNKINDPNNNNTHLVRSSALSRFKR